MKYVILADSDNVEPFVTPRQLTVINGETLIGRTVRLLKENGVKDILITSHDKRFDNLGAKRYEPLFNDYKPKEGKGYWLSAFPIELINEPITFLLGDCYYSEKAIKKIVETKTNSIMYFCSYQNKDERYIKHHDEPFGFKIIDTELFKNHISLVKEAKDKGLCRREPIAWELYRSINGLDINKHIMTDNYIAINDESCDIDVLSDIINLERKLGGKFMLKVKAIKEFTLGKFNELKNIERANPTKNENGKLYENDIFECDNSMADYLMGQNPVKEVVVEIIEVIPEEKPIEPKVEAKPKKTTKKKTSKK